VKRWRKRKEEVLDAEAAYRSALDQIEKLLDEKAVREEWEVVDEIDDEERPRH
jgi:hypothetical protein